MSLLPVQNKKSIFSCLLIALIAILLFARNYYSFCWSDESLYLSSVYRLWKGDVFYFDEWNLTGVSSYIWLPVFSIYMKIIGSTDGIYLFFRNVYTLISLLTSIKCYLLLHKKYGEFISCASSVFLLIFSRANIMGCSYYNTALVFYFLFVLYLYDVIYNKEGYSCLVCACISGIFAGFAIIINPYLGIALLIALVYIYKKNKRKEGMALFFSCLIIGGIFVTYYLFSIKGKNISFHTLEDYARPIWLNLLYSHLNIYKIFSFFLLFPFFGFIIGLFSIKRNKLSFRRKRILGIFAIICFLFLCIRAFFIGGYYIAFSVAMFSMIPCVWHEYSAHDHGDVIYFGSLGFVLVLAFQFASNNLDSIGIGFVMLMIPALIIFNTLIRMLTDKILVIRLVRMSIFIIIFGVTFFLRIFGVYRDAKLEDLSTKITRGPAKGIYTTEEHFLQYNNIIDDLNTYVKPNSTIFISKLACFAYLCTDARCSAPTTWRTAMNDESLQIYYANHDVPQYVLVLNPEYGGFEDNYIATWGDNGDMFPNSNSDEGWLYNYMNSNGYTCYNVNSGKLYCKE